MVDDSNKDCSNIMFLNSLFYHLFIDGIEDLN